MINTSLRQGASSPSKLDSTALDINYRLARSNTRRSASRLVLAQTRMTSISLHTACRTYTSRNICK